jgi:intraflagellar transport protein 56
VCRRDYQALNVYIGLCYYKLDYYDVSLEVLHPYLRQCADSIVALNLKACNHFRLYNGKAAEQELKPILETVNLQTMYGGDLIKHNLVRPIRAAALC